MINRNALLIGLAEVVRRRRHDPKAGGLDVMRAMRAAGATWRDVLPVERWIGRLGWRAPSSIHGGTREQMAILLCGRLDVATPMQLAEMAVILATPRTVENEARAVEICSAHNALIEAEWQAEVAAMLARTPGA